MTATNPAHTHRCQPQARHGRARSDDAGARGAASLCVRRTAGRRRLVPVARLVLLAVAPLLAAAPLSVAAFAASGRQSKPHLINSPPHTHTYTQHTTHNTQQVETVKSTVAASKVVVYSKTTCPYCSEVKALFARLNVPATVIELNQTPDGAEMQAALSDLVGRRTVPQVFVGGAHVGGCDDTMAAHAAGKLAELLAGVGIAI